MDKAQLLAFTPSVNLKISEENCLFFQKWMAARYRRSSFANNFETCLKNALEGKFHGRLSKIVSKYSSVVRTLLFKVTNEELDNPKETPYPLEIYVLYTPRPECPDADKQAKLCAENLFELFEEAFYDGSRWSNIFLEFSDSFSDEAMTVAQHDTLKQWRLDYHKLSSRDEDALPPDDEGN